MFRRSNLNKKSRLVESNENLELQLQEEREEIISNKKEDKEENNEVDKQSIYVDKIKREIDQKIRKIKRGISITPSEEKIVMPFKKDESRESTVKKLFISEISLQEAKNPEEKKKLLGVKREDAERIKEEKKRGLVELQKSLFSLPKNLEAFPATQNDHVENLIKLSTAGLIEVPVSLEQKIKKIEQREIDRKNMSDNLLVEELDYLKVLQKIGPSYARGYKSDLSHKRITQLNNIFENVFVANNSRKRKLLKQKKVYENRALERDI